MAGRTRVFEARNFGLILGAVVFALLFFLTFATAIVRNVEENVILDICFNWKLTFKAQAVQEGVTLKTRNPFISPDILIVGIDNRSLQRYGKWPFPRAVHAGLINSFTRVQQQNDRERALFLDINFIEPDIDAPENDALLVKSIRESGRVFLDTFLQPGESTGTFGKEQIERQKALIDTYGEVRNIVGDINRVVSFRSVEAPLKPYARATRGYGNASYVEDVDNVFRRQPLVARMQEHLEDIEIGSLTTQTSVNAAEFERLAWDDKDGVSHAVVLPLTDSSLEALKREIQHRAPARAEDTNNDGKPDAYRYFVHKYRDHFVPAITLALALEYLHRKPSDIEVVLGKHIRVPRPEVYNPQTQAWEPFKLLVKPARTRMEKDKDGKPVEVPVSDAQYRVLDELLIPVDGRGTMLINFMGPRSSAAADGYQTFPVRPYSGYNRDPGIDPATWPRTKAVANKILMVGVFATGLAEDEKPTPYGLMYGVEINANALNTVLMHRFLIAAPVWVDALVLLAMIGIVAFMSSRLSTIWSLVITLVLVLVYFLAVVYVFDFASYILTFTGPASGALLTLLAVVAYRVITEERDKRFYKTTFGKYLSPDVIAQMRENPPELGGVDKEITVFFSDIRSYTELSETMTPQELVNHLNEYLTAMSDIIVHEYKGTLDKYVGDMIMCFWGAPLPQEDHALLACRCSLAQVKKLDELNAKWPAERRIHIGIGLNTGIMTVGNMGSSERMNYTLLGDNVNLGSRLEGTNKAYHTTIIISEFTYGLVKDKVVARELDVIRVKGKNKPVGIYELVAMVDGE
jgi:adenylate cyclase